MERLHADNFILQEITADDSKAINLINEWLKICNLKHIAYSGVDAYNTRHANDPHLYLHKISPS